MSVFDAAATPLPTFTGKPLPHQAAAVPWLFDHPRCLLADDVGLGKTVTTLALLARLHAAGELGRCLVVAPAALTAQWREQAATFAPGLTVGTIDEKRIHSPGVKEHKALREEWGPEGRPDVEVTTYQTLRSRLNGYLARGYRTVVLDEVQSVKGQGPEHAAALAICQQAERTLGLSATPVELDVMETWRMLHVLGAPGLPSQREWGERYVVWQPGYQPPAGPYVEAKPIGVQPATLPELRAYLSSMVLRRTQDHVRLQLPVVAPAVLWTALTPQQRFAYAKADRITHPLTRSNQREEACAFAGGRSAKAEAALALLTARPDGEKAVIWAYRLEHLAIMGKLLTAAGIGWVCITGEQNERPTEREAAIHAHRDDPTVRVLLGSDAISRGLNLQHASVLVSLGSSWNPAAETQREGRIRRIGSAFLVVHHITILADTEYEKEKWARMQQRGDDNRAVLD